MKKLLEMVERNAQLKSRNFAIKMENQKRGEEDLLKADYNPKTARSKSLKNIDRIFG